jgi:hypothetical protein
MNPVIPRYQVDRVLSRTSVGTAYAACESYSGRDVVVEVASDFGTAEMRARFMRDAMIAQRLEGEHVLRILDVGTLSDGTPYIVREPIVTSLATEVRARGPIEVDRAVGWTLSACEAIAEGHALGMVHGDIRAENVFLARTKNGDLDVKVRWTSVAKAENAIKADYQRDIAGLAELLRALLSGQVDLIEEDRARTIPTPIAELISSTISVRSEPRMKSIADFANALAEYAPDHEGPRNVSFILSRAGMAAPPPRISRTMTPQTDAWFEAAPRPSRLSIDAPPPRGRGKTFAAVALGLVAAVALGSFVLWRTNNLPTWTGAADPAELYGTTTVTSAEIRKEATSDSLAADVTDDGIIDRSEPLTPYVTKLKPTRAIKVNDLPSAPAALARPPITPEKSDDAVRLTEPPRTDEVPSSGSKTAPTTEQVPFPPIGEPAQPTPKELIP